MQKIKTSPVLVPPPPVPPGRIGAAGQEPSREPLGSDSQIGFLADVLLELRRFVWPVRNRVSSASLVTFGMLVFFAVYIYALDAVAGTVFRALGFYSK